MPEFDSAKTSAKEFSYSRFSNIRVDTSLAIQLPCILTFSNKIPTPLIFVSLPTNEPFLNTPFPGMSVMFESSCATFPPKSISLFSLMKDPSA